MELDHIVLAVHNLDAAAEYLDREHGLASYVGGSHPGWGTANRIVPFGSSYLELIAVVDDDTAGATGIGRWVGNGATAHGAPIGWAVRPDDLDATAQRLGLTAFEGSRTRPDGATVRWRMAGIERSLDDPQLPWFIEWPDHRTYPGSAETAVDARVARIALEGSAEQIDAWLGAHRLPLDVRDGTSGIAAVVVDGPRGTIRLERD